MKTPSWRSCLAALLLLLGLTGCVAVPPLINVTHREADPDLRSRLDAIDRRLDHLEQKLDQAEKKP